MTEAQLITSPEQLCSELDLRVSAASAVYILTDSEVAAHCLPVLLQKVPSLSKADIIEIEQGEYSKSIEIASHIWLHLLENHADRKSLLLNFGGGVVTDLGGFIGATYKRGIPYIHIPTSLLAMVDAAIGGKNGIDHGGIKNSIGTFSDPDTVLIDPSFLSTLPEKELRCGFAEMLKHSLITDAALWSETKRCRLQELSNRGSLIAKNISIKEKIVRTDPLERGNRQLLNFGHTIGHALESFFIENNTPMSHGEAVGYGMMVETLLSENCGSLNTAATAEILETLNLFFSRSAFVFPRFDALLPYLSNDKKNSEGKNRWVLLRNIGQAEAGVEISEESVEKIYTQWVSG
ncbi:MAG: 3-dehydroquinate synthase [Crocinitomicaceae bacterium]|nr:3-dehydroquinate synthase [Crocinitomicaceae bacterium]